MMVMEDMGLGGGGWGRAPCASQSTREEAEALRDANTALELERRRLEGQLADWWATAAATGPAEPLERIAALHQQLAAVKLSEVCPLIPPTPSKPQAAPFIKRLPLSSHLFIAERPPSPSIPPVRPPESAGAPGHGAAGAGRGRLCFPRRVFSEPPLG